MSSEQLHSAIAAIRAGDKVTGSRLLAEIIRTEPFNETAWILLSNCVDDIEKKKFCLKKALSINPSNPNTVKALSNLEPPTELPLEDTQPTYLTQKGARESERGGETETKVQLGIDFYSKTEVAIKLNFARCYPFPDNETGELFLFACSTLRQLSNIGNHVVAKVLALLLLDYNKATALEWANGTYEFPTREMLELKKVLHRVQFQVSYEALQNQILYPVPKQVQFKGDGKKFFHLSFPPLNLKLKGFGLLGFQVNFYAFHSVLALITYLGRKHINDEDYLTHLATVAQLCGKAYFMDLVRVGMDHVGIANEILKTAGVMP